MRGSELERRGFDTAGLERANGWVFAREWLDDLRAELLRRIGEADPLDPGVPPPADPWADEIVPLLGLERRGSRLYVPGATAVADDAEATELEARVSASGLEPVRVENRRLAELLEADRRLVRVGDGYAVGRDAYERARDALVAECRASGSITLARFRDLLGVSRRPAQMLLERFDADGLTRRVGDARVLRRRATS